MKGPPSTEVAAMLAPGTRLKGRYRLERLLGRGGMAAVWLASDEVLDRPVAIKVLSDAIAADPEFRARFRREARVAAGLSHPNLIGVYDYAEAAERPYLVMEYVPGNTLAERLSEGAAIDCARLARELLGALAHIHAAGIVHRDVKPQNVLLPPGGEAKLIDFGIALPDDATALTSTGHLLGTARYMAPEVIDGAPASERSDLYSCGVVLRDCLTHDPVPALNPLAERLAAPDPRGRPASAGQALAQLERRGEAVERPTARFDVAKPGRRVPAGGAALAVFALTAVVGLVALADGGQEHRQDPTTTARAAGERGAPAVREQATRDPATVPEPAGDDAVLGGALNQQGFELIQAGRAEEAIPVLEEAVRAFPPDTEDLDYAYALFNLGNALRLSGRAEEAIPVLERRLEIPDQTETVRRELAAARSEAGP